MMSTATLGPFVLLLGAAPAAADTSGPGEPTQPLYAVRRVVKRTEGITFDELVVMDSRTAMREFRRRRSGSNRVIRSGVRIRGTVTRRDLKSLAGFLKTLKLDPATRRFLPLQDYDLESESAFGGKSAAGSTIRFTVWLFTPQ